MCPLSSRKRQRNLFPRLSCIHLKNRDSFGGPGMWGCQGVVVQNRFKKLTLRTNVVKLLNLFKSPQDTIIKCKLSETLCLKKHNQDEAKLSSFVSIAVASPSICIVRFHRDSD